MKTTPLTGSRKEGMEETLSRLIENKVGRRDPIIAGMLRQVVQNLLHPNGYSRTNTTYDCTSLHILERELQRMRTSLDVVVVGTGQYVFGDVLCAGGREGEGKVSDKAAGVIFPVLCHLRNAHSTIRKIGIAGTDSAYFSKIRSHVNDVIGKRMNIVSDFEEFPAFAGERNELSYLDAIAKIKPQAVIIATPDHLHFSIAMECVKRGIHVLCVKPLVMTLRQNKLLLDAAIKNNVLVQGEWHKQWDHFFQSATSIMRTELLSGRSFGYFSSEMSQPYTQRDLFKWAATHSDINYYLNSHFMFFLAHALENFARPSVVTAQSSIGLNRQSIDAQKAADRISVAIEWNHFKENNYLTKEIDPARIGVSYHSAGWANIPGDVHTEQRISCQVGGKDISLDQSRRGMLVKSNNGAANINPHYMDLTCNEQGVTNLAGRYGYESIKTFIDTVLSIISRASKLEDIYKYGSVLPTVFNCRVVTAVLEASTLSQQNESRRVKIQYDDTEDWQNPTGFEVCN